MSSSCSCSPSAESLDSSNTTANISALISRLHSARARSSSSSTNLDDVLTECCVILADDDISGSQAVIAISSYFDEVNNYLLMIDLMLVLIDWQCYGKLLAFALDEVNGDVKSLMNILTSSSTSNNDSEELLSFVNRVNSRAKYYASFPGHEKLSLMKKNSQIEQIE